MPPPPLGPSGEDDPTGEATGLPFVRVTVLGASYSGKTALVNAFVNNSIPSRYVATEHEEMYYKKTKFDDHDGGDSVRPRAVLVEVEDTPGSERGPPGVIFEDEDEGKKRRSRKSKNNGEADEKFKIKMGSRVEVCSDLRTLMRHFHDAPQLVWRKEMEDMAGNAFWVKEVQRDGSVGLPSPDGSNGGIWVFPAKSVKLHMKLELEIDKFTRVGATQAMTDEERRKQERMTPIEKAQRAQMLQMPFSAYTRRRHNGKVKTLTKNRMGFLICFDCSDETGASLQEAMSVHGMLKDNMVKERDMMAATPIIWLVACKTDNNRDYQAVERNLESAEVFGEENEMMVWKTSAYCHRGVNSLFEGMMSDILSKEMLWLLEGSILDPTEHDAHRKCIIS